MIITCMLRLKDKYHPTNLVTVIERCVVFYFGWEFSCELKTILYVLTVVFILIAYCNIYSLSFFLSVVLIGGTNKHGSWQKISYLICKVEH